ncbi:MAG: hypothetical protein ACPGTP_06180 [Bacteroidia bacterium]
MNNEEIQWIRQCLPKQISYPYYKDKFALDLLDFCFAEDTKVQDIKKSKFGGLLNKQAVKNVLSRCGNGKLNKDILHHNWEENSSFFKLTLGEWGELAKRKSNRDFDQVSRPEKNLVLQVNFGSEHDTILFDKIGKENRNYFINYWHPINRRQSTMGWIRMDIDFQGNEILIEEVQNDWLRDVIQLKKNLDCNKSCCENHWVKKRRKNFEAYYLFVKPYFKIWDEILLSAALHFTKCELGITQVWYHTNESSKHYKMMSDDCLPPRSIYKNLPEKFGFSSIKNKPSLIQNCSALKRLNRKGKDLLFYHLELKK